MKSNITYKLFDAALRCGIQEQTILEYISFQWIIPADPIKQELDEEDIARINLIAELQEDLGVNDESVPIILHLIDEINHLHLGLKKEIGL